MSQQLSTDETNIVGLTILGICILICVLITIFATWKICDNCGRISKRKRYMFRFGRTCDICPHCGERHEGSELVHG